MSVLGASHKIEVLLAVLEAHAVCGLASCTAQSVGESCMLQPHYDIVFLSMDVYRL